MVRKIAFFFLFAWAVAVSLHAQSNEQLRDSLRQATEQLAYHPDSIDLRLKKAAWNIMLQQWEYAKDDLDKVLYLQPTNIAGLYYRAFVNDKLRRYNFARLDYQNLLVLVPGNFQAQLGLALLNQKDRHFTEAFDQINQLVEQFPDSAVVYAARGGIEKERGMVEMALLDYEEAMKRDTTATDYLVNYVDVCLLLNEKGKASEGLKQLLKRGIAMPRLSDLYRRLNGR